MRVQMRFLAMCAAAAACAGLLCVAPGCRDACEGKADVRIGTQFFSVIYKNAAGQNYLTDGLWRPDQVVVYEDVNVPQNIPDSNLVQILPGYASGVFGPFKYTDRYLQPGTNNPNLRVLIDQNIAFRYFIRKDTTGTDTFTVRMLLEEDECHTYWTRLEYYRNGARLDEYTGKEQAEMVFVQ